jgi:thiamine-phosphate pyrophosphorylase
MVERARAIHAALQGTGVPLVVNDRVDVALIAGVEGVHVGREDMLVADVRRLLGPDAIIGLTVKNEADAQDAIDSDIDYACIGGLFETPAKHNLQPIGFEGFGRLAPIIRKVKPNLPIGAIAGIDLARTPPAINAGADGVAVISAIFRQSDPQAATAALRAVVDETLKARA